MILWKQFVAKVILAMSFVALNANAAAVELWSEYSTTEIQQSNNYYNYIKNIQPSVDKYFPEYSSYFKNVLDKFNNYGTAEKYLINIQINKVIKNIWEYWEITTEKDKATIALIVFDYLEWNSKFIKDTSITSKWEDIKIEAANQILKQIKREYDTMLKSLDELKNDIKNIHNIVNSWVNENNTNTVFKHYERNMNKFKEYIIDAWLLKESKDIQERIRTYIKLQTITWKQPSEVGKIFIDEYNRIIKK